MRLTNAVGCPAGWTVGFESDGRELLIIAIKATYDIPTTEAQAPRLSLEQVPLVQADEFTGKPGESAVRCETDYAHRKLACDVLLVGSAYAPEGRPATRVPVELAVGPMVKRFQVVGNRFWQKTVLGISSTEPEPFLVMPFSYDVAFGGTDLTRETEGEIRTFLTNPVGKGYWHYTDYIDGQPLPNTERVNEQVDRPDGKFAPMAFGAIGRNWSPRLDYVGTYDKHWIENDAPFWPQDFDHRYFQAAPPSQVIPYPRGGEEVSLKNLTPTSVCRFRLPVRKMPVTFVMHSGTETTVTAEVDTVFIEPDAARFCLVWRANLRLERSIFDVKETIVGDLSADRQRAKRFPGKPYYRNLAELVAASQRRRGK